MLFVEALTTLLDADERFEVVGTATTGREAVQQVSEASADVVLMDMSMPVLDGVAATRRLLAARPELRVIALSGHTDALSHTAALEAGAAEYVEKSGALEQLTETILRVAGRPA